jgi:hypothetical protein
MTEGGEPFRSNTVQVNKYDRITKLFYGIGRARGTIN